MSDSLNLDNEIKENSQKKDEIINEENINVENCLALTVIKDYKLVTVKKVAKKAVKDTFKVAISMIALNIIKLL